MNEQERLIAVMQSEGLNAKQFAVEVGISPATMSNVVNGRNNPSLEVMQKVLNRFRNLSTNWLILGVGSMYDEKSNSQDDIFDAEISESPENKSLDGRSVPFQQNKKYSASNIQSTKSSEGLSPKQVTKVLVFYDDGTFDELTK